MLQWGDIFIAGTGVRLGELKMTAAEAIGIGCTSKDDVEHNGQVSTVISLDDYTPDMAVVASRNALRAAKVTPEALGAVIYGVLKNVDINNSTSYIQRELNAMNAFGVEVRASCNGLAIVEIACQRLRIQPRSRPILVTCAHKWDEEPSERWRASKKEMPGDGASAVILSTKSGFARLISLVTTQDPKLAFLLAAPREFDQHPAHSKKSADHNRIQQEKSPANVVQRKQAGLIRAVRQALEESCISIENIDHVVVPHLYSPLLIRETLTVGLCDLSRTTFNFARRVGHIGPGDAFAGLDYLARRGVLKPGQKIMIYSVGIGFTWSCAVLEVLSRPTY
ncbi:ketoacyl-ACP synthase III family protein [Streptomyces sp. NPDC057686]|uniref:ketoacyl-ACP synthase III family protein n=1 Tax=Streptomyces sp. NPDC057686 TaxID=3346212 RepID=UPI0036CEF0DC